MSLNVKFQIGKKFKPKKFKIKFDDWDRYAKKDGWVCRNDDDCTWIDSYLGCDDREFVLSAVKVGEYLILTFGQGTFLTLRTVPCKKK